jgi:hypothetical protein
MDASRTHEVTHGQSVWSWVVVGAVGLALALAITVGAGMNTTDVVVEAPAAVDAGAATGIREGAPYAGAYLGSFTDVRESGTYYGAEDVGATPGHGRCPPKHGC